ncbi:MAG TPA: hypothetical protein VGN52_12745 [Burkholderiales bacterium]|jgi:hypothetical protein
MATRKFNRKPIDVREIGGVLGFFLSAFADEIKRNGMPQDPVAFMHDMVHGSLHGLDSLDPPPTFENRDLHLGLVDGIHAFMHARGDNLHDHHHG